MTLGPVGGTVCGIGSRWAAVAAVALASPGTVRAEPLAPLQAFLRAGWERSLEGRLAVAQIGTAEAQRLVRGAGLAPRFSTQLDYRRHHREVIIEFPTNGDSVGVVFLPLDQIDSTSSIRLPVVDLSGWWAVRAESALVRAATLDASAQRQQISLEVARLYYEYVGATALVEAARFSRAAARNNADVVEARAGEGASSELDVARATAELARRSQEVARARQSRQRAARDLAALTDIEPEGDVPPLPDDLAAEAPLAHWLTGASELPAVRAGYERAQAGRIRAQGARLRYAPVLDAVATHSYTNATGFGPENIWALGGRLAWEIGLDAEAEARLVEAEVTTQLLQTDLDLRDARTRIADLHDRIDSLRARAVAAQAEAVATARASEIARVELLAGGSTQLDVVQAQRDAFTAASEVVRALAELAYARAALRIAAARYEELP